MAGLQHQRRFEWACSQGEQANASKGCAREGVLSVDEKDDNERGEGLRCRSERATLTRQSKERQRPRDGPGVASPELQPRAPWDRTGAGKMDGGEWNRRRRGENDTYRGETVGPGGRANWSMGC